jgi:lambda repressor-like predicted transcriptional regulator
MGGHLANVVASVQGGMNEAARASAGFATQAAGDAQAVAHAFTGGFDEIHARATTASSAVATAFAFAGDNAAAAMALAVNQAGISLDHLATAAGHSASEIATAMAGAAETMSRVIANASATAISQLNSVAAAATNAGNAAARATTTASSAATNATATGINQQALAEALIAGGLATLDESGSLVPTQHSGRDYTRRGLAYLEEGEAVLSPAENRTRHNAGAGMTVIIEKFYGRDEAEARDSAESAAFSIAALAGQRGVLLP